MASTSFRKLLCGVLLAGFALAEQGCEVKAPWSPYDEIEQTGSVSPDGSGDGTNAATQGVALLDIGDIEQTVYIEVALDEASAAGNIAPTVTQVDPGKRVALLTLDIAPPIPQELWLNYYMKGRNPLNDEPVVMRAWIMRDNVELGKMAQVLSGDIRQGTEPIRINAFQELAQYPDTTMLTVKAEACVLAAGTDVTTVDPWTATSDRFTKAVKTPAVRINFLTESATPATPDAPVTEPAAEPVPAPETPAPAAEPETAPADTGAVVQ